MVALIAAALVSRQSLQSNARRAVRLIRSRGAKSA
jgi:hypothetical protein